jgi:hypothetical protein
MKKTTTTTGTNMKYEEGAMVRVKLPEVSYQSFLALIIEDRGSVIVVDTCFPIGSQTRWIVKPDQISSMRKRRNTAFGGSPSLQRELKKIIRK